MIASEYTYEQKRIALVGVISLLDNKLIVEKHAGNRKAIGIQIAVLREILRNLHDQEEGQHIAAGAHLEEGQ